ncbi:MAG: hypothetical protein ACTSRS_20485 [Candidatus Helarchaeota archaeon]
MKFADESSIRQLNRYLVSGNIDAFKRTIQNLRNNGVLVDLSRIPEKAHKISDLFVYNLQTGMNIDEIFRILQFANDYELFTDDPQDIKFVLPEDAQNLLLANLKHLFGTLSEGFFQFIVYYLPNRLSEFLLNPTNFALDYQGPLQERINFIYSIIDMYSNYGLRTRKIGLFKDYLKIYERNKKPYAENYFIFKIKQTDLIEFGNTIGPIRLFADAISPYERHLIYDPLLQRIQQKFEANQYSYEYPIVAMVVTGGTGPQGKGFAYLTPLGEVIEVCSDARQNLAYIIEYKKYLKSIFLQKLEKHIQSWNISPKLKKEIIDFFQKSIHTHMVDFHEIEMILERDIYNYFKTRVKTKEATDPEFLAFLRKSLLDILIPVQLEDQFKVRMDLITKGQLSEIEVARLVSLGDISHLDILNQRLFFLLLVDNITRILKARNLL